MTQTFETAEECLNTNYYGAKRMVEALAPLLQLSDSARIVNISSFLGLLEVITNLLDLIFLCVQCPTEVLMVIYVGPAHTK